MHNNNLQWPPKALQDIYNSPEKIKKCHNECNSTYDIVHDFEISTNLNNLPDSNELKCYIHCAYITLGYIKPNSLKINFQSIYELSSDFTDNEVKRMTKLYAGCEKRIKKIKDLVERVYMMNVCAKQNANEVSIDGKKYN